MEINKNDIPLQAAHNAHAWTSMDPDKRAEQEQAGYFEYMTAFYTRLMEQGENEQEREYLEVAAIRYKAGYIAHNMYYLSARSRCASSMVTGGSNFNTRRNDKANSAEQNKSEAFAEWQKRAQSAILKGLREMRTEAAGGPAVIMRQEIENAEKIQGWYLEIRKQFRKEADPSKRVELLKTITGLAGEELAAFVRQNYIDADGLPVFLLTNGNARLKAMRERLAQMEKRDATPTTEKAFEGGTVRDNAEADRIQIIYKERPGPELYGKLKARGFRWSPSAGAWQRYRTQDTRYAVEAITGVKI
jgi:hypothetical protein